jgi:hypothetical protein
MSEAAETAVSTEASAETHATRYALGGALLYLVFYAVMIAFNANAELFPLPPLVWALLPPLTTVAYLVVLLYAIRLLCRPQATPARETLLMCLCLFFFLLLNPTVDDIVIRLWRGEAFGHIIANLTLQTYDTFVPAWLSSGLRGIIARTLEVLVPFLLILTGTYFGQLLARVIREQAMLVPVGIVAGLVDLWGVYWGPVSVMSEHAPTAVSGLATAATTAAKIPETVKLPEHLAYFGHMSPPDNIGIGDFVFLAFFLTCAYRFGFSVKRTMWGIFAGLLAASVIIALNGVTLFGVDVEIDYLPGLLFICGGVLIANAGAWKLSRQEWAITGVITALMLALVGTFAVRAVLARPLHQTSSYTVTAATAPELIAAVRAHLVAEAHTPPTLDLIAANVFYANPKAPEPLAATLWFLGRQAKVAPRTTREYTVTISPVPKTPHTWAVEQSTDAPPEQLIGLLAKLSKTPPAPNALDDPAVQQRLLGEAKGMPAVTPALLAQLLARAQPMPKKPVVPVRLLPTYAMLLDAKGAIVRIPYAELSSESVAK